MKRALKVTHLAIGMFLFSSVAMGSVGSENCPLAMGINRSDVTKAPASVSYTAPNAQQTRAVDVNIVGGIVPVRINGGSSVESTAANMIRGI